MSKTIGEMSYTEILNTVKRRPMWAVDKMLKLTEIVEKKEAALQEIREISAELLTLVGDNQALEDFMNDKVN